jgi:hypothetical protein
VTNFASCVLPPPCSKDQSKYCATCNRWFFIEKFSQYHLILKVKGKLVCQWRQVCRNCSYLVTSDSKHECFKNFVLIVIKNNLHVIYATRLHNPSKVSNKNLYIFFDMECTQDPEKFDASFENVPNLVCVQQMCSKCEAVDDVNVDCEQCGKRVHTFWHDPVGKFIDYLRLSRLFADTIFVISHNSRAYDAQFLLRRFLELMWNRN